MAELPETELPGLDLDALAKWLDAERPGLRQGPLTGQVIAGGKSNITYRVGDGTSLWAVRRPPLGHVLPTAHDMGREFRVISALHPTAVPVPDPVALCTDLDVLRVNFYVMGFVDGVVLDKPELVDPVEPAQATRIGEILVDTLAELHAVDPATVGLGDFGRPDGYLERQLRRWHQQWQSSETRPLPLEAEVVEQLTATLPVSGAPAIVHGDYRLSNVICAPALDEIRAIVDWEMATIGDPLADVGLMYLYHRLAETIHLTMPVMAPERGFLTADQLVARYAEVSGRDTSRLSWYIAFAYFKLAVIAEGIAFRHLQGKTVGEGFDRFGDNVPLLLDTAKQILNS